MMLRQVKSSKYESVSRVFGNLLYCGKVVAIVVDLPLLFVS